MTLTRTMALVSLLVLVWAPGTPALDAVLYEVTETMTLNKGGQVRREATAALTGFVRAGTEICPEPLATALGTTACTVTAIASDAIDTRTGTGPVSARFSVVVQDDNPVDAAEFEIVKGELNGVIDLSPAVVGLGPTAQRIPLGFITGTWKAEGIAGGPLAGLLIVGRRFSGVFRLPFATPPTFTPMYLLDPTTGAVEPVAQDEHAIGMPTVRLEITFEPAPPGPPTPPGPLTPPGPPSQ